MIKKINLFEEVQQYIPGGVNSPVRAFGAVGGVPIFIDRAKGAYIFDVNNHAYIDYVGSWGPMILGHAEDAVIAAVQAQAEKGLSYGAPCIHEIALAKKICEMVLSIEKIRFVNSGTEACMSAIRLARGYTGRDKIVKFRGCYHGHADLLLVEAGSGALTSGIPNSAGVPQGAVVDTLLADYNDVDSVTQLFEKWKDQIAAVIVEPIAGNMNFIRPQAGFLPLLREITQQYGALLIFDEVMTGFRVGISGVQGLYDLVPDITTFGKIVGGGLPVGAFGGRADIMDCVAPLGSVYQAGTLSGNPLAMVAGLETLNQISKPEFYTSLSNKMSYFVSGIQALQVSSKLKQSISIDAEGGMFGFYLSDKIPTSLLEVKRLDMDLFAKFFHKMLESHIYIAPSAFESGFISVAHTELDFDKTFYAFEKALK